MERIGKGDTEHQIKVCSPMQAADVKQALMSTHNMHQTGLRVVLDGKSSYVVEQPSGKTAPIKYEHGRYFFDIWAPAPIKKHIKRQRDDSNMD